VESAASIRYLPPRTRLDALHKSCAPIFKGDGSCLMKCLRKGVCSRAILSRQAQGAACRFDFAPYKHASTASKIRPPDCIMRGWTACNYVKRQLRNSTVNPWSPAPTPHNNRLRILPHQVASSAFLTWPARHCRGGLYCFWPRFANELGNPLRNRVRRAKRAPGV
jgi:hypothetical protein